MNGERQSLKARCAWSWLALFLLADLIRSESSLQTGKPAEASTPALYWSNDYDGQVVIRRYGRLVRRGL